MGLFTQKNTGKDVTFNLLLGGVVVGFSPLIRFHPRRMVTSLESRPLNGPNNFDAIPDGWEGDFEWDRDSSSYDSMIAQMETAYWSGQGGVVSAMIDQLVRETSGQQSQFQFTGVALGEYDAGDWRKETFLKQSQKFRCSLRVRIT